MRRYFVLLISIVLASNGQDAGSTRPIRATLKSGSTAGRLVVPIAKTPAPGDRLVIGTDTNVLKITVVTPDGRRITSANADANGFEWSESPDTPPIGSTDGGFHAVISFKGAGATGDYTIDFASRALPKQAAVEAWYVTDRDQYDAMFKQIPGAQRIGPVAFDSSKRTQDLTLSLAGDETGTLIDIVVSDPNTTVSLKLPGGAILTPKTPKTNDFEWKTVGSRDQVDPPGAMFGIGGFLLPRDGTHHVIMFRTAAKGDYGIHLELSGSSSGQAEAMVLPLERMLAEATAEIGKPPKLPEGAVLLQPTALPYNCFVGDKLDLAIRLVGDPVAGPVRFQVKVETRTPLPYKAGSPQEYAPPKVVTMPVTFTRGPGGEYRGVLIPRDRGIMRVSIAASGTSAAGKPFRDETMLTDVAVAPVVATFVSLTERAVDDDGNGRPDRLEITATLDVVTPGEYKIRFDLSGQGGGMFNDAGATLAAGRSKLTTSIPAVQIFERLKEDGPYRIANVQLYRPEGNSFGNFVKGTVPPLKTAAYKRDQWDRGKVFGEEKVELRPVRPGKSGKFTAVEVTWEAVTQGGECSWSGGLSFDNDSLHLIEGGDFPKGPFRFSFEFPAFRLAKATKGEGHFQGIVSCGNGDEGSASAFVPLKFDPAQFEPSDASMHVFSQFMIRAVIGGGFGIASGDLEADGTRSAAIDYRVTSAPAGITPVLQGSNLQVTVANNVAPGRYYIGVEATRGAEKGTGEVVVDVVPALPPPPLRPYAASAAKARGMRPNQEGKFQNLEVLWPVDVPGGDCSWNGSIRLDADQGAGIASSGRLLAGKSTLALTFDGGVVGNSAKPDWTFKGHVVCDNRGREPGVSIETKLALQPSTFAKRPGLPLSSDFPIRLHPGAYGVTSLTVKTTAPEAAVFELVNPPAGFHTKFDRPHQVADIKAIWLEVSADETVPQGRYYLPVKVTVGANQGTADVVVDVMAEQ